MHRKTSQSETSRPASHLHHLCERTDRTCRSDVVSGGGDLRSYGPFDRRRRSSSRRRRRRRRGWRWRGRGCEAFCGCDQRLPVRCFTWSGPSWLYLPLVECPPPAVRRGSVASVRSRAERDLDLDLDLKLKLKVRLGFCVCSAKQRHCHRRLEQQYCYTHVTRRSFEPDSRSVFVSAAVSLEVMFRCPRLQEVKTCGSLKLLANVELCASPYWHM